MKYVCVDRGTERCPCYLMEAGQCYTCTMAVSGICSCEDAAGWQGCCPYTEYLQQGRRILKTPADNLTQFDILSKIRYSGDLFLVRLGVSAGFAQKCRRPGAYVMAEALGWRTPISVLRAEMTEDGQGTADFLVKAAGPKTLALTSESCSCWNLAGPYYSGLINGEKLAGGERLLVIARGTAAAPLVNLLNSPEIPASIKENCRILLDDEALPAEFMEEYLKGHRWEPVCLPQAEVLETVRRQLAESVRNDPQTVAALLVSQYYVQQLIMELTEEDKSRIILPNPANLCCSMGLCGACSHTDSDGVTVRLCKCSHGVVE